MGGDWSTGLFGCFADPGSFCLAMCGWPFLVGKIFDLLWLFLILLDSEWPLKVGLDDLILRQERRSNWWRWNTLGIIGLVMLHEFPAEKPNQKETRWNPFNDPIMTLNNLWRMHRGNKNNDFRYWRKICVWFLDTFLLWLLCYCSRYVYFNLWFMHVSIMNMQ